MAVTAMKIPLYRCHSIAGSDVQYHDDVLKQLKQEPIVFNDPFHGLSASMDLDFMQPLEGNVTSLKTNSTSSSGNNTTTIPPTSSANTTSSSNTNIFSNYTEVFENFPYNYSAVKKYVGYDATSEFSGSMAISSKYIVVGASGFDKFSGVVHVYQALTQTSFSHMADIYAPNGSNINFGVAVDVYGDTILIGANGYNSYRGVAYIYTLYESAYWILNATIHSPLRIGQGFGRSVALYNNTIVIGTGVNNAYVYEYADGVWQLVTKFQPLQQSSNFGRRVDIYKDTVVIGADRMNTSYGAAFVYRRVAPQSWSLMSRLQSVEGYNSFFGHSVAIYENTIAVGAVGYRSGFYASEGVDDWSKNPNNTGWVYLYDLDTSSDGSVWNLSYAIQSPVGMNSYFGKDVSLNSKYLAVGAPGFPNGDTKGASFMYRRNGVSNYSLDIAFLSPGTNNGYFGYTVRLSDLYNVIVGAIGYNAFEGAVYLLPLSTKSSTGGGTSGGGTSGVGTVTTSSNGTSTTLLGVLIALLLLVLLAAVVAYTCGWSLCGFCCPVVAPPLKKKKKKKDDEDDDSPYTVHSYVGYSEIDDNYTYNTEPVPYSHAYPPRPGMMPPPAKMLEMEKEKALAMGKSLDGKGESGVVGEGGIITQATEGYIRKLFPYKVHSYRGYEEDQAAGIDPNTVVDDKIRANDAVTQGNTMVNAGSGALQSMQSMNSMASSDYFGDEHRRIFSENSFMGYPSLPPAYQARRPLGTDSAPVSMDSTDFGSVLAGSDFNMDSSFFQDRWAAHPPLPGHNGKASSGTTSNGSSMSSSTTRKKSQVSFKDDGNSSAASELFVMKKSSDEPSSQQVRYISPDEASKEQSIRSYVDQAKAQYAEVLKRRMQSQTDSSVDSNTTYGRDVVVSLPQVYAQEQSSVSDLSQSMTENSSSASASYVEQARQQYAALKQQRQRQRGDFMQPAQDEATVCSSLTVTTASSNNGITVETSGTSESEPPHDMSFYAVAPASSVGSSADQRSNLVQQARARYSAALARLHPSQEGSESSGPDVQSPSVDAVSTSASSPSGSEVLVQKAKAQYARIQAKRSEMSSTSSSSADTAASSSNSSINSSTSSEPSYVELAKAQYSRMLSQKQQNMSPHSSSNSFEAASEPVDDGSIASTPSSASSSSAVDLAKARYAEYLAKKKTARNISEGKPLALSSPLARVNSDASKLPSPPPTTPPRYPSQPSMEEGKPLEKRFEGVSARRDESFTASPFLEPLATIDEGPDESSDAQSPMNPKQASTALDSASKATSVLAAARQRLLEEEKRAQFAAQSAAAEEGLKEVQERNRLKEEARIRAEEKARARFAMFKAKVEQHSQVEEMVPMTPAVSNENQQYHTITPILQRVEEAPTPVPSAIRGNSSARSTSSSSSSRGVLRAARAAKSTSGEEEESKKTTSTTSTLLSPYSSPAKPRSEDDNLPEP
eukprot:scaffold614_cov157-Ochromonas_danica.AAC.13